MINHAPIKTKAGTILQLQDIKGKPYLNVPTRITWFREEHPDWTIRTIPVRLEKTIAIFECRIENEQGRVVSTAHKTETPEGFFDYIEKAETGAIGRALGYLGYGTLQSLDLDEGTDVVDAPTQRSTYSAPAAQKAAPNNGAYVVGFGKFKDMSFSDIPSKDAKSYAEYLKKSAKEKGKNVTGEALTFVNMAEKIQTTGDDLGTIPF